MVVDRCSLVRVVPYGDKAQLTEDGERMRTTKIAGLSSTKRRLQTSVVLVGGCYARMSGARHILRTNDGKLARTKQQSEYSGQLHPSR